MTNHGVPEGASRPDWGVVLPEARHAMIRLEAVSHHVGLSPRLLELVKIRVSQINGCAYCLDMHTKDARAAGEREQRLYALSAWRETSFFTPEERAALEWTEALTRLSEGVPDQLYQGLKEHFNDREIVGLTSAIVTINAWNRWAISMRSEPGSYRPNLAK
ncbi:MAG: carboxymuconolactone decarboxylase family protein [Thermaerobacter sp.]|nr:carboxymuconolactone decarboxylase family protein [Thermaerobacter sp.]